MPCAAGQGPPSGVDTAHAPLGPAMDETLGVHLIRVGDRALRSAEDEARNRRTAQRRTLLTRTASSISAASNKASNSCTASFSSGIKTSSGARVRRSVFR